MTAAGAILTSDVAIQSEEIEASGCRNLNGGFNRFLWPVRRTVADKLGSFAHYRIFESGRLVAILLASAVGIRR